MLTTSQNQQLFLVPLGTTCIGDFSQIAPTDTLNTLIINIFLPTDRGCLKSLPTLRDTNNYDFFMFLEDTLPKHNKVIKSQCPSVSKKIHLLRQFHFSPVK